MRYCSILIASALLLSTLMISGGGAAGEAGQPPSAGEPGQPGPEVDLALSDVYIARDCKMSIKVTNVGDVAILSMYSLVAETSGGKPEWQARMPVSLAPGASKEFPVPGRPLIGIETIKIGISPDPMRSIQSDRNTSDKTLTRTMTCRDMKCPPGFSLAAASSATEFKCTRQRPSAPCPQGYHVTWGPCSAKGADSSKVTPECSFACVPDTPDVKYDCGENYPLSTPCLVGCSRAPAKSP